MIGAYSRDFEVILGLTIAKMTHTLVTVKSITCRTAPPVMRSLYRDGLSHDQTQADAYSNFSLSPLGIAFYIYLFCTLFR